MPAPHEDDAALLQQLFSSTTLTQEREMCCVRSETGCSSSQRNSADDSLSSTPSQHLKTTSWWAPLIKDHVRDYVLDPKSESTRPRTVVSACAGACSEAEVLKAAWPYAVGVMNLCQVMGK